jgi:hypothetical protein
MKRDQQKAVDHLSKYGTVKTCKRIGENVATIILTNGFSENATTTFEFLKDCMDLFPDLPALETCITENNLAVIVLSNSPKPTNQ